MDEPTTVRMPVLSPAETITVRGVLVCVGQYVHYEQVLFELDASKAILELPSPSAGVVEAVLVTAGDSVECNSPLLILRPTSDSEIVSGSSRH